MSYVDITNVSFGYDHNVILNDVSFSVSEGGITGILGRNGSGKTTIIKILAGLLESKSGEITINGEPLNRKKYDNIIGYCPQENSFVEKLTVEENVDYFGILYDLENDERSLRTKKIIYALGLDSKIDVIASSLSGGQKRRLNIACSIVNSPRILLMDEPTIALDPASRISVWRLIKRINETGTTIIISSNMIEEIQALCNNVIALRDGSVIYSGSPGVLSREETIRRIFGS